MAHTQQDVIQSRIDLANSIQKEISIHQDYISSLKRALSAMKMVAAIEQPVPLNDDDTPATRSFIKGLADKISDRSAA